MGFEPTIFGLRDRRLTTWPPRQRIASTLFLSIFTSFYIIFIFVLYVSLYLHSGRILGGRQCVDVILQAHHSLHHRHDADVHLVP